MAAKKDKEAVEPAETETVKMERDAPQFEGGPVTADVHPDSVADYESAGWQRVKVKK